MQTRKKLEEHILLSEYPEIERSTFKCIKLKEGHMYYGQVATMDLEGSGQERKLRHGFGLDIVYRSDGSVISKFEGFWSKGKKSGQGLALYSDKSLYKGEFKNNMKHGQGVHYWPSGQYYQGQWKEDRMDGNGMFVQNQSTSLTGLFKNNNYLVSASVYVSPFLAQKDITEMLERKEQQYLTEHQLQKKKQLIVEPSSGVQELLEQLKKCRTHNGVPLVLRTVQ